MARIDHVVTVHDGVDIALARLGGKAMTAIGGKQSVQGDAHMHSVALLHPEESYDAEPRLAQLAYFTEQPYGFVTGFSIFLPAAIAASDVLT